MNRLTDDLIRAAEDTQTPVHLNLLLNEAALCILRLETRDLYDQKRLEWLEDLGSFAIDKSDGEHPTVTVQMCEKAYFVATAPTVREAIDLAFEECSGVSVCGHDPEASERAKFEAWMCRLNNGDRLARNPDGGYEDVSMDYAWLAWLERAKETI
ncbi:hypothetical protein LVJ85_02285 [Neisseria sp. Dent CA1/247]|uniref:hypothetical protein n=1 Tax=Neisseria sp. Dent CA1/247 TaxID=2912675 RepID=UPI001FCFB319|nr:hypothetical protein [Neisseria sp. Dent CA1/247]UOO77350.1 hypothetical protein LVJ85_02285 [Neisseria sp. Dent CA1/247]